jgi:hypothetical protein
MPEGQNAACQFHRPRTGVEVEVVDARRRVVELLDHDVVDVADHGVERDRIDAGFVDDLKRRRTISAQSAGRRIEKHIADFQAVAIFVGVDLQLGKLRAGRAAVERNLENVARSRVIRIGLLEIGCAEMKRRRADREQLPRLHLLEAAEPGEPFQDRFCPG